MATLIQTSETPEEAEARRRAATAKRIKILAACSALAVVARIFISDPKRTPPPDYTKMNIKIVPGMLDSMPASARAKLDPQLVAKMVLVDEQARRGEYGKPVAEQAPSGPYKPADAPTIVDVEAETFKEQVFAYARKRRIDAERQAREESQARDIRKATLVQFASGGYVRAEAAEKRPTGTAIRIDKNMEANVPSRWVASIQTDALDWQEPVPAGQVRLRPAKGITVILHRDTASRVTVEKNRFDEI
jgi:hypothetical protein